MKKKLSLKLDQEAAQVNGLPIESDRDKGMLKTPDNVPVVNTKRTDASPVSKTSPVSNPSKCNKSGGMILNKQNFVFNHLQNDDDIRKDYQINDILGSGAYGEVRKCVSKKTGKICAVKIIKQDAMNKTEQKQLEVEIEILKQIDHPNIIKVYEAYKDKKRFFIVTELCTGGELFDQIIKRPYYSERDAAVVMKQVMSAVAYCHGQNIVHRDLKPENLLLE